MDPLPGMRNKKDVLYSCLCCSSAAGYNRSKTAEKREWRAWAGEYESPDSPQCPLDGIRCTCNRDPVECDPWRTRATGLTPPEGVYSVG